MKATRFFLILPIVLGLAACIGRQSGPTTYALSGKITANGAALAGVTVSLAGATSATASTDATGAYSFTVQNGNWTVTPALSGYGFAPASLAVAVNNGNTANENFTAGADGSLDASFGGTGIVTTAASTDDSSAYAVALQADGKIVAVGPRSDGGGSTFGLLRYKADGSLDATFGAAGKVSTAFGTNDDEPCAVAIQADGKIVAAGFTDNGTATVFAVARYNTDGSLDTTFAGTGKATAAVGATYDYGQAVAIQPDGKIVVAGYSAIGSVYVSALVRFKADGTLDAGFGPGGKVTTAIGASSSAYAVTVQPDGKIVTAGKTLSGGIGAFALARYGADGTLDAGFGTAGIVITAVRSTNDSAQAVAVQTDGKIVAGGLSANGSAYTFGLVRYTAAGALDAGFGTGGKVVTAIGALNDAIRGIVLQADGKIVAAGYSQFIAGTANTFALVRYKADGSLDTIFGDNGKVTTPVGTSNNVARGVGLQADGKIVAGGYALSPSTGIYQFAVVRYWP